MTLTAWDIYWVTRLDEISIALAIVGFGCVAGLIVSLALVTHPDHDRWFKPGKKICVTSLVVGCIGLGGKHAHSQHEAGRRDDRASGDCQL